MSTSLIVGLLFCLVMTYKLAVGLIMKKMLKAKMCENLQDGNAFIKLTPYATLI